MSGKRNTNKHSRDTKKRHDARGNYYDYSDMEDARNSNGVMNGDNIARKLIYLTEANHHNARGARALQRRRGSRSANVSMGTRPDPSTGAGGRCKRSHSHKLRSAQASSSDMRLQRLQGGYNAYLESPRRNGLTPRNLETLDESGGDGMDTKRMNHFGDTNPDGEKHGLKYVLQRAVSVYRNQLAGIYPPSQLPVYACNMCNAKFTIKSLLGAHRRTHDNDFKVRSKTGRMHASPRAVVSSNQCKYCDRFFDLERTLHIHQLCYCAKIPPQHRRRLGYTEMLHEKKAPLPSFQRPKDISSRLINVGAGVVVKPEHVSLPIKAVLPQRWR